MSDLCLARPVSAVACSLILGALPGMKKAVARAKKNYPMPSTRRRRCTKPREPDCPCQGVQPQTQIRKRSVAAARTSWGKAGTMVKAMSKPSNRHGIMMLSLLSLTLFLSARLLLTSAPGWGITYQHQQRAWCFYLLGSICALFFNMCASLAALNILEWFTTCTMSPSQDPSITTMFSGHVTRATASNAQSMVWYGVIRSKYGVIMMSWEIKEAWHHWSRTYTLRGIWWHNGVIMKSDYNRLVEQSEIN
jgi:hypothetical protein